MKYKGFVSDMDGVVADTEPLWFKGTQNFLKKYGAKISKREYAGYIGQPEVIDAIKLMKKYQLPLSDIDTLLGRRNYVLEVMEQEVKPNDSYIELLEFLKEKEVKMSLASSSPRVIMDVIINKTKINGYFVSTVSAEEAGGKKRAYEKAVKSLGLESKDCFNLEDSERGGLAAKEIGLYCVIIPNEFSKKADFSFADEIYETIEDFLKNGKVLKNLSG